jgi:hypothetical protein
LDLLHLAVIAKLRSFRQEIDKNAFVVDLREIIPLLQKTNCWPSGVSIKLKIEGLAETKIAPIVLSRT